MNRDRLVQVVSIVLAFALVAGAGAFVPRLIRISDEQGLRYTDVSIDGAPPIVAIGTAIGALRGLIVDYLWIKVNMMKEKGQYYEVMADSELITKLQPRFAPVWAFHGHNMAYNISVKTETPEERWQWVKAGIDLVRNEGLRYNPNDLVLHKELAFWFAHKIDGLADDAHLHYKREMAREWHLLLGPPPPSWDDRKAWIDNIANAPDTFEELAALNPDVVGLAQELTEALAGFDRRFTYKLDGEFLRNIGLWRASKSSAFAQLTGLTSQFSVSDPVYAALDEILSNPENGTAAADLIAFLRKRVLLDEYNMDPAVMAQLTRDIGPLDWRHPQAHALYWAHLGSELGKHRVDLEEDVYKALNNDRVKIQAMQALARTGVMSVDPFSGDNPTRLADTRWIRAIDDYFFELYDEYFDTRGAGSDTFIAFHENFMKSAVRQLYRLGDREGAQRILDKLDTMYGTGALIPNTQYDRELDVFVQEITRDEYLLQPWAAYTDVTSALEYGFREGLLRGDEKLLEDALKFARDLTVYFRQSEGANFTNKFGEQRMAELVDNIDDSVRAVFERIMLDSSLSIIDRLTIYNRAPEDLRKLVYDSTEPLVRREFEATRLAQTLDWNVVFPEPPGMEVFRLENAERERARAAERERRLEAERR